MSYTFKTDKRQTSLEQKLSARSMELNLDLNDMNESIKDITSTLEEYKKIQASNELDSSTIKKIESIENFVKEVKPLFDKLYFDCNVTQ